jgi:hypothetical protein
VLAAPTRAATARRRGGARLRQTFGSQALGMIEHGATHRLAWPARIQRARASIEIVYVVRRVFAWRHVVHA